MSYRDERDALLERVHELEARLCRLEAAPRRDQHRNEPESFSIVHTTHLEAELPHAITEAGLDAIADAIRRELGVRAIRIGSTLVAPRDEVSVSVSGRHTRLVLRCVGGVDAWVGWASAGIVAAGAATARAAWAALSAARASQEGSMAWAMGAMLLVAVVGTAGATAGVWRLARRCQQERLSRARRVFDGAIRLGARHAIVPSPPPARAPTRSLGASVE